MNNRSGKENAAKFLTCRGKPLVRCGDVIYYGSMKDKYMIKLEIKSKRCVLDMDITGKAGIQSIYTSPDVRVRKQVVKSSEKEGLYLATDIADAWL